jgi:hypothetical protein
LASIVLEFFEVSGTKFQSAGILEKQSQYRAKSRQAAIAGTFQGEGEALGAMEVELRVTLSGHMRSSCLAKSNQS